MAEVENDWRSPTHASSTGVMNNNNSTSNNNNNLRDTASSRKRNRSNSKSNGYGHEGSNSVNKKESENKTKADQEALSIPVTPRNKYTHIIILKSLNETFETKFLVVPFKPESLKLGRPVVSSNGGSSQSFGGMGNINSVNKQDQQVPQVRPDNGHFDSRVLSRNHAALSCDANTGNIYIRDLKSSNGTFVNGSRIDQNDIELKVGDIIDLGTDIDSKFEHRKISAFVEDISVIPLINDSDQGTAFLNNGNTKNQSENVTDTATSLKPINGIRGANAEAQSMTAQQAAFEAAMFGDVNNLDLEDTVLGSETEVLSGIFINNSIGTSPNLINVVKTLATEIALEKHEFVKLKSMESFLMNYITNLDYVNRLMVEKNDKQLVKLQNALRQKLTEKQESISKEHKLQVEKFDKENKILRSSFETKENEKDMHIKNLERELDDLRTRLEVEKYRNSQLSKTVALKEEQFPPIESTIHNNSAATTSETSKEDKPIRTSHRKISNRTIFFVSAVSIGFVAFAMRFSSEH